jgi:hypothetical protein
VTQLYLKEKTKIMGGKDITTDKIITCLSMVDFSEARRDQPLSAKADPSAPKERDSPPSKDMYYKLFILVYITQNGTMLTNVDQLNILPFILETYLNSGDQKEYIEGSCALTQMSSCPSSPTWPSKTPSERRSSSSPNSETFLPKSNARSETFSGCWPTLRFPRTSMCLCSAQRKSI